MLRLMIVVLALSGPSLQAPPPGDGPTGPQRDPLTVRGCVEGRRLRVVEHDQADLSGIRNLRLKGSRAMLETLKDEGNGLFELTGRLERPARDRIETQRKHRIGDKTTVSIGAAAEQHRGEPTREAEPEFVVEAFTRLDDTCPAR